MVSHLKLSIPDAQTVLADLSPWLKKTGFLDLNGSIERLKEKAGDDRPYRIFLRALGGVDGKKTSAFCYLIYQIISSQAVEGVDHQFHQTIEETILNCRISDGNAFLQAPEVRMINISALFQKLIERLSSND